MIKSSAKAVISNEKILSNDPFSGEILCQNSLGIANIRSYTQIITLVDQNKSPDIDQVYKLENNLKLKFF